MKESQFIGTLMPSHPEFQAIVQEIRHKYQLPEVDPDGDPITEIYLDDKIIPLGEFRQELQSLIETKTNFLPPELAKFYTLGKNSVGKPLDTQDYEIPDEVMKFINAMYAWLQNIMGVIIPIVDAHYTNLANMLYVYLLTGETEEVPADWISKVVALPVLGETVIFAMANQTADPEITVQQFRELYKKTFGTHRPKLTKTVVSTAYYMQLKRIGKPWNYIVEEFIRLNKYRLPRDRTSKKYFEVRRKYEQVLKKRMQRSEIVLDVLARDKN